VKVRPEQPLDYPDVYAVHAAAFGRGEEPWIVEAIRKSDRYVPDLSLVAEDAGEIVGHVILSYVDLAGRRVLELGPMGVLPDRQRQGIGSALVRGALRGADDRREPLLLVLGHPWFYPRFGFRPASQMGIEAPVPVPDDVFMAIQLHAYDPALRGRVVFPPWFA
jgi:putative acetyltransferase